jgi:hypothetical protein
MGVVAEGRQMAANGVGGVQAVSFLSPIIIITASSRKNQHGKS